MRAPAAASAGPSGQAAGAPPAQSSGKPRPEYNPLEDPNPRLCERCAIYRVTGMEEQKLCCKLCGETRGEQHGAWCHLSRFTWSTKAMEEEEGIPEPALSDGREGHEMAAARDEMVVG